MSACKRHTCKDIPLGLADVLPRGDTLGYSTFVSTWACACKAFLPKGPHVLKRHARGCQDEVKAVRLLLEEEQKEAQVLLRQVREQAQSAIASGHEAVRKQAAVSHLEARERLVRQDPSAAKLI
jgi:hypothetical protein